jgi:hypothetical protein
MQKLVMKVQCLKTSLLKCGVHLLLGTGPRMDSNRTYYASCAELWLLSCPLGDASFFHTTVTLCSAHVLMRSPQLAADIHLVSPSYAPPPAAVISTAAPTFAAFL